MNNMKMLSAKLEGLYSTKMQLKDRNIHKLYVRELCGDFPLFWTSVPLANVTTFFSFHSLSSRKGKRKSLRYS